MNKYSLKNYNFILMAAIIALNVIGILAIQSATVGDSFVRRQIVGVCAGIVIMVGISFFPYRTVLKLSIPIYIACCVLLALVLVLGLVRGGARRWVVLPVLGQLQPSEFTKIGLVVFFSALLGRNSDRMGQWNVILMVIGFMALPLLLILLEPDLSTTIIILVSMVSMIFVAGIPYKIISWVVLVGVPLLVGGLLLLKNGLIQLPVGYWGNRILAFVDKDAAVYTDANQQQRTSIMAIASGKLYGKGLNSDAIESVKNGNFLSEQRTDFIFAVIGEELGFLGCTVVILLYAVIVFQCFRMAKKAVDMEGRLLCTGMAMLLGFQSFTNIAVATGLFPNTGLPLPFISYGVSSLLSMYIGMGIVLNVGLTRERASTRRYL